MKIDPVIEVLLDLDGARIDQGDGYQIIVEAWLVTASAAIPHGLHYSLSLHNPDGKRILGYDNAHAVKPPKKYAGRVRTYDHKHRHPADRGVPYEFTNAQQLLNDFFADVTKVLQEVKR
ncbi:MAG: hypothetical protein JO002_12735 [Burkholderiaceae bacterium]|nr:hypothetical protein [Burkholderiaceae bacterium]